MTKAERAELRKIVELFSPDEHGHDNWTEGFTRLCRLAGMVWPAGELRDEDMKTVDITELMNRGRPEEGGA